MEVGGIDEAFCRNGWDPSAGAGRIGQAFYENGQDLPNFLWEWEGLVKIDVGTDRIAQDFCGSSWDWSYFLQNQVGLVKTFSTSR